MTSLLRRWAPTLVAGAGIWLVGSPLLVSPVAPAPVANPAVTESIENTRGEPPEHHWRSTQPLLVIGQMAVPPAARSAPALPLVARADANWISIPRIGLSQPVGWYRDCLGRSPVPRWGTWRWSCAGANNTYVMAHNPGAFTPILGLRLGDTLEYADPSGRVHTYRVRSITVVANTQLWPLDATAVPLVTLQTCWSLDGSRDFIVRALEV